MIKVIKAGISAEAAADMDAKVKAIVESTLKDIETRGDVAVRELSEKFDKWSPKSFRLSEDEISAAIARLPEQKSMTSSLHRHKFENSLKFRKQHCVTSK